MDQLLTLRRRPPIVAIGGQPAQADIRAAIESSCAASTSSAGTSWNPETSTAPAASVGAPVVRSSTLSPSVPPAAPVCSSGSPSGSVRRVARETCAVTVRRSGPNASATITAVHRSSPSRVWYSSCSSRPRTRTGSPLRTLWATCSAKVPKSLTANHWVAPSLHSPSRERIRGVLATFNRRNGCLPAPVIRFGSWPMWPRRVTSISLTMMTPGCSGTGWSGARDHRDPCGAGGARGLPPGCGNRGIPLDTCPGTAVLAQRDLSRPDQVLGHDRGECRRRAVQVVLGTLLGGATPAGACHQRQHQRDQQQGCSGTGERPAHGGGGGEQRSADDQQHQTEASGCEPHQSLCGGDPVGAGRQRLAVQRCPDMLVEQIGRAHV